MIRARQSLSLTIQKFITAVVRVELFHERFSSHNYHRPLIITNHCVVVDCAVTFYHKIHSLRGVDTFPTFRHSIAFSSIAKLLFFFTGNFRFVPKNDSATSKNCSLQLKQKRRENISAPFYVSATCLLTERKRIKY